MTNFDKLKQMSSEEFGRWLMQRKAERLPLFDCGDYCRFFKKHGRCPAERLTHRCPISEADLWKEWLDEQA